jgi:hypothetical protein
VSIPLASGTVTYCAVINVTGAPNSYIDLQRFTNYAITKCGANGGEYILDGTAEGNLQPGMSKGINLGIRLAYGVFQGSIQSSTLQIIAVSAYQ